MSKQRIKRTTIFRHNPTNIKINTYNTESLALPCCQIFGDMEMNQQQSNLTNYDANPEI